MCPITHLNYSPHPHTKTLIEGFSRSVGLPVYSGEVVPAAIIGVFLKFYYLGMSIPLCDNVYSADTNRTNIQSCSKTDFVLDSDILSQLEVKTFRGLLKERSFAHKKWYRLFDGAEDDFSVEKCHAKCTDNTRIVWVIHTTDGNVFGAYSSRTWSADGGNMTDEDSFLFLLRSNKEYPAQCFDLVNKETPVVWFYPSYFCLIGNGNAICIAQDCTEVASISGVNVGHYKVPSPYYLNGDEYQVVVKNIEIFSTYDGADVNDEVEVESVHVKKSVGEKVVKAKMTEVGEAVSSVMENESSLSRDGVRDLCAEWGGRSFVFDLSDCWNSN